MRDEDSTRFAQWWTETGSKINGKFALAVACWEEAQKGLGIPVVTKPVEPIVGKVIIAKAVCTVDNVQYKLVEGEEPTGCQGCVARRNVDLCNKLSDCCAELNGIWVEMDKED
jgi:hypothetical protein